jgi:hypothetical protein
MADGGQKLHVEDLPPENPENLPDIIKTSPTTYNAYEYQHPCITYNLNRNTDLPTPNMLKRSTNSMANVLTYYTQSSAALGLICDL